MNQKLLRLLRMAGYPDTNDPDLWQRVVMLNNRGAIPRPPGHDRDKVWHGFHLLLMDRRGTPTHLAKCRSADDPPLERECLVLGTLGTDPVLQRIIPQNHSASSEVFRLHLSRWLPGVTLERMAPRMAAGVWSAAVQSILERASLVSDRAAALLPDLLGPQPTISAMAEAADDIATLRREGVAPGTLDPITVALADSPPLPRPLQHGDLWPGNIISWGGDWWLLDFEVFGRVQVPLHDVFHLLRANPGPGVQTKRGLSAGPGVHRPGWSEPSRAVLGGFAARLGLSPAAVGGAYLYYLVEVTARLHGRRAPHGFRAPYLDELRLVAADLEKGLPLEALIPLPAVAIGRATSPPRHSNEGDHVVIKSLFEFGVAQPALNAIFAPLTYRMATVFTFHRFANPDLSIVGHDPHRLAGHLEYLRRHRYHLVGIDQLLAGLDRGEPWPHGAVAFTVDDGYRDFVDIAAPVFAAYDCPVTLFAITGFLDGQTWLWWDQVEYVMRETDRESFQVEAEGKMWHYAWHNSHEREAALLHLVERMKGLLNRGRLDLLTQLMRVLGVSLPEQPPARYAPTTWDDVRATMHRGVQVGAHTVTHPILSRATDQESRREIEESVQRVRAELSTVSRVFCYPNGDPDSFGDREIRALSAMGMRGAVTTTHGYVSHRSSVSNDGRFRLSRFPYQESEGTFRQIVFGLERVKNSVRRIGRLRQ